MSGAKFKQRKPQWTSPYGAMTVTKLPSFSGNDFCESRCQQPLGPGTATRSATHVVSLLGHESKLCSECLKVWRDTFKRELGIDERAAA